VHLVAINKSYLILFQNSKMYCWTRSGIYEYKFLFWKPTSGGQCDWISCFNIASGSTALTKIIIWL